MKNVLKSFFYYVIVFAILVFVVTFVYVQYLCCTHLVAGSSFPVTKALVGYSLSKSLPLVIYICPLILIIFKIRHPKVAPVRTFIAYVVLMAVTWLLALPASLLFGQKLVKRLNVNEFELNFNDNIELSGKYFRKLEHNIYYFIDNSQHNRSHVVELYNDGNARVRYGYSKPTADQIRFPREQNINVSMASFFAAEAEPFRDTYLKEVLDTSTKGVLDYAEIALFSAQKSFFTGPRAWVVFLSVAVALCSVWGYTRLSSWRLVNYLMCVATSAMIFVYNCAYYTRPLRPLREALHKVVFGVGLAQGEVPKRFPYFFNNSIDLPLAVCNLSMALLIVFAGVAVFFIKKSATTKE